MRSVVLLCSLSFLAGCSKPDNQASRSAGGETGMAAAADTATSSSAASLTAVAGKWQTHSLSEAGDTLGTAELRATADSTGWTLTFPRQKPIPVRVLTVGGDSIVTAAEYPDFADKKAQIHSRAVLRFQGDKMVGTLEAHILKGSSDSLIHARLEGTRER